MCIRKYISNFKKQTGKKNNKKNTKKVKRIKEQNENISEKMIKKTNFGRPGEDFSHHPHFRKQEYFFLPRYKNLLSGYINL